MLIKRDSERNAYGVWIKTLCSGCEVDGDYSRVMLISGELASDVAHKCGLSEPEAVALLYRYHRSR